MELFLLLMNRDKSCHSRCQPGFHIQSATSENLPMPLDRSERRCHSLDANRIEVPVQEKTRTGTAASDPRHQVEAAGTNFLKTGGDALGQQEREQMLGQAPFSSSTRHQSRIYRLDLNVRIEAGDAAFVSRLRCN